MKIKINKKKLYLSIYLFMFIFMPPFIPSINILYILDCLSFVLIVFNYKMEFKKLMNNSIFKSFNKSFFLFMIYAICRNIVDWMFVSRLENNEYIVNIYRLIGVGILINVCSIYIVVYCDRNQISFKTLVYCIINAGIIESLFTIIMIISPFTKQIINNIFVANVYGSWEKAGIASWTLNERLYGFANVLYDGFGYGTGIIAGIAFWLLFDESYKFKRVIAFILLLVVPTVNALTGVFIAIIAILLKLFQSLKQKGFKGSSFISIITLFFSGGIGIAVLRGKATAAIIRLENNVMAMIGKNDGVTSYSNLMRNSYWTMPDTWLYRLFGSGHSVYTTSMFMHSDTGYTNMVWMVGIIGSIWLYSIFIIPLIKIYIKSKSYFEKGTMLFLVCSILFFEIKGIGIAINTGMPIILTLLYKCAAENNVYNRLLTEGYNI